MQKWSKMSGADRFYASLGIGIASLVFVPLGKMLIADVAYRLGIGPPAPVPEETMDEDNEYVVLSKMDNFPLYLEREKLIPSEDAVVAEQASDLEENQVVGKIVVCDRQPPLWVAAAAKKVVVVPLTFDAGRRRNEASVEEIAQAAGDPEVFVFRTSRLN